MKCVAVILNGIGEKAKEIGRGRKILARNCDGQHLVIDDILCQLKNQSWNHSSIQVMNKSVTLSYLAKELVPVGNKRMCHFLNSTGQKRGHLQKSKHVKIS